MSEGNVEEVKPGEEAKAGLAVNTNGVPLVPLDLLVHLEGLYPPRCKAATEPLEAHMEYAGHVKLVAKMRKWYSEQTDLEGKMKMSPVGPIPAFPPTLNLVEAMTSRGPRMGARRGRRLTKSE